MRKLMITALVAASAAAATAQPAQAADTTAVGPCAIAINLIYKYDLYPQPGPYFPELDDALRTVCGVTG